MLPQLEETPGSDMEVQQRVDASCSVLGLTTSLKIDSLIRAPRRSPRLHASSASPAAAQPRGPSGMLSPSRRQSVPAQQRASSGQGILEQLSRTKATEEQAEERLHTPRKQQFSLSAVPDSARSPGQDALQRSATPRKRQQPSSVAPGSASRVVPEHNSSAFEHAHAMQHLSSPRKPLHRTDAAPGSGSRVMQDLMEENAQEASELHWLSTPRRQGPPDMAHGRSSVMQELGSEVAEDARPSHRLLTPSKQGIASNAGKASHAFSTIGFHR